MKTLCETIFDTTANPEDFVVWRRVNGGSFEGDPDEVNPIFQQLLDPIISQSKKIKADIVEQAMRKHNPVLVVSEPRNRYSKYIHVYNTESGKLVAYSFYHVLDRRHAFKVVPYVDKFTDSVAWDIFDNDLRFSPNSIEHYYSISKKDVKIIEDFYNNLQKRVK